MRPFLILALAAIPVAPAPAKGPVALSMPLRCDMGRTCWIQKYADLADGPERRDYRCGALTTDAHDGVDFRLSSLAQMRLGVVIVSAAPGVVLRVRDGEADVAVGAGGVGNGRDAGNGVVVDHGDGWETQYSHLMKGSVRVRPGDRVAQGATLGAVGLSGNTEYPHLHFSIRHAGIEIDPFSGQALPGQCGNRSARPLWDAATLRTLSYQSGQIVRLAFADAPQSRATLQAADPRLPGRNSAMVLMVERIDVKAGDVHRFDLRGPDGRVILTQTMTLERGNLSWIGYAGKKPPATGWQPGRYMGSFTASRAGSPDRREDATIDIR